jgi:hypothetical protein
MHMRERPYRERKPKKRIEEDAALRDKIEKQFPAPVAESAFQEGYRECISMFALHAPNKRFVAKILDEHCVVLENACLRSPTRENYAAYEGFRAAMKELRKQHGIR